MIFGKLQYIFMSCRRLPLVALFLLMALPLSQPLVSAPVPAALPPLPVALTFDDGPRPVLTPQLKALLARHQVKGTFFVVGKMAAKEPQLVKDLFDEGHEIANHTWNHWPLKSMSTSKLVSELDSTQALIREITGQTTWLYRTPGSTKEYLENEFVRPPSYELVLWDVHSLDHTGISAQAMATRLEAQIKPGDIVLLHNGLESSVQALDQLLPKLQAKGFQFSTVSALLQLKRERARLVRQLSPSRG